MITCERGLHLIKKFEGLRVDSYLCPASVWTIGYGNTSHLRKFPDASSVTISVEFAEELLRQDLRYFERKIHKSMKAVRLNNHQFSALVSFSFNLGIRAFNSSTLRKVILDNPNNFSEIEAQFLRWKYAGGRVLKGLIQRRTSEFELFCFN